MPFQEGEVACLPIEYLDANSLAERGKPILTEAVALKYIRQIGEALKIVHQQGIIHRDICPENIFLRINAEQCKKKYFGKCILFGLNYYLIFI